MIETHTFLYGIGYIFKLAVSFSKYYDSLMSPSKISSK
jgi:hypothetical protein